MEANLSCLADGRTGVVRLRLYVAGDAPNSVRAAANLRAAIDGFPPGLRCEVETVDALEQPQRASEDGIFVTPTLLFPAVPPRVLVGDLSDAGAVRALVLGGETERSGSAPADPQAATHEIELLVSELARSEANLEALISEQVDAIVNPDAGAPILLREAQAALRRSEQHYRTLAYQDPLTGLANRRDFLARLEHALQQAARRRLQVALLYLDVDRFKPINDTLGHDVGDQVLLLFAERLRACVRTSDLVARIGGDEFAVLMEVLTIPADAARLATKIIKAISAPMHLGDREVMASTSVGIALFPGDGSDGTRLLRAADAAMYRAKQQGGGGYVFYDPRAGAGIPAVLALEEELRLALRHEQLELFFLPEIAIDTERVVGMEALLRWHHPRLGLLSPPEFIAAAEHSGLLDSLSDWVLTTALRTASRWRRAGHPARVGVNLTAAELGRPQLVARLRTIISDLGLQPGDLEIELEIPERLLGAANKRREEFRELKGLGIHLALDQCVCDPGSFSMVENLPVSRIKVSPRITRDIARRPVSRAVIRGLVSMVHELGMKVSATGIDSDDQLKALRDGCDEAQGFLVPQQNLWVNCRSGKAPSA